MELYRATLHEYVIYDVQRADKGTLASELRWRLEFEAGQLAPAAERGFRAQIPESFQEWLGDDTGGLRLFFTGEQMLPSASTDEIKHACIVWRDGLALICHTIWMWDGMSKEDAFALLHSRVAGEPKEDACGWIGTSLLESAAPGTYPDDFGLFAQSYYSSRLTEASRTEWIDLKFGRLYFPEVRTNQSARSLPVFLAYHSIADEQSPDAARFTVSPWPEIATYWLKIERIYERHLPVQKALGKASTSIEIEVGKVFASQSKRPGQIRPRSLEESLSDLLRAQYSLLEPLARAEQASEDLRREHENLKNAVRKGMMSRVGLPEGAMDVLTQRGQFYRDQLYTDVASAQQENTLGERAVSALRTRAEILGAKYDRRLNWIIGVVGVALAAGQILDEHVCKAAYGFFMRYPLMQRLLPVWTEATEAGLVAGIRLAGMIVIALLSALILWAILRWRSR